MSTDHEASQFDPQPPFSQTTYVNVRMHFPWTLFSTTVWQNRIDLCYQLEKVIS